MVTGGTGFLGKPVLAALLRHGGGIRRLVVPVRAIDDAAARRRLREEVLSAEPLAALGDAAGLGRKLEEGRIRAVACDLERDEAEAGARDAWGEIDVVIHCAATVSFEEPLDDALALNAFGPLRLLERLRRAGSEPHFVHVSTAYVADRRSGEIDEDGLVHHALAGLDPERMLAEAREWREEAERESRADPQHSRFARSAERDASRRDDLDAGERAEEVRRRWVLERLSKRGRRWAQAAGWPDTYALSKALGERLLAAEWAARTTIVRPTIIESALRAPRPGWLEGIKVADPLILAYASRGLTHLPGRASNRIDIVPVDLVANACVVAAAHPAEAGPRRLAVASSSRNPLQIGELAENIRDYFRANPLQGRNGAAVRIGELRFVDRRVALRRTIRRERLAAALARAAIASPVAIPQERLLRANRALAERVTRMVKIYGAYTELDCAFDDSNARRLAAEMHEDDRDELSFDTAAIDWEDYLQRVHLPQVRRLAAGGPPG
jgi:nucleoside-diphosphate-sugar epimerase